MKKLALLLTVFICLSMSTYAVPDSIMIGPYKISFDLGISKNTYNLSAQPPLETETLSGIEYKMYKLYINDKLNKSEIPRFITIEITKFDTETRTFSSDQIIQLLEDKGMTGAIDREIDGSQGVIAKATISISDPDHASNADVFVARFYPSVDLNRSVCAITSTYPWDEGTLALLKTIHIEKNGA